MEKLEALIETLSADGRPVVRRAALREAGLRGPEIGALIDAAIKRRSKDPAQAERLARAAFIAARAGGDHWWTYRSRKILAQTHIVRGEPRRALRLLSGPHPELTPREDASLALDVSQTLSLLGRRDDALALIRRARSRQPEVDGDPARGLLYAAEAHIHCTAGVHALGLDCLEKARRYMAEAGKPQQLLSIECNRASALRDLGRLEEAEAIYREIIPALVENRGDAIARMARLNLALIGIERGAFHQGLRDLRALRLEFEAVGDKAQVAECNLREAEVNLALHMPTQAVDHAARAAEALDGLGLTDAQAEAEYLAAVAARGLGRNAEAVPRLEAALAVFDRPGGDRANAAVCLLRLAESDALIGELGRAMQRGAEAVQRLRALGWHERASYAEVFLARIERQAGEPRSARYRLEALLDGPHAPHTPWVRCEVHRQLGLVEETLGRLRPALRHILSATRILERYRVGVPPDEYMAAFLTSHAELFEDAVRIVLSSGGRRAPERAFELSEQARARSLLDLIRSTEQEEPKGGTSALQLEVATLEREIDAHIASPARRKAARKPGVAIQRAAFLSAREARLAACLDQLAVEAPDVLRRHRGAPLRYAELMRALPPNQLLLEYYVTEAELHVFALRRGSIRHVRKPVDLATRRDLISRSRFQLDRPEIDNGYREDAQEKLLTSASGVLEEMDLLLLTPFRDELDVDRVVIVPHGELHAVPFTALERDGVPLIEEVEVVVAPSAAVYLHCLDRETATGPALFMGYADQHAPEIDEEIRTLAASFESPHTYVGPTAMCSVLEQHGASSRIIHLAAHTEYRHDDSMESRLQLADGWLTVTQVYGMRIAPELLVLSGCATGRVSVTPGGDLFGLVRGFLHAGASSILSSLWEVSDGRTRDYMERFYRAYGEGLTVAAAARRATLEMRAAHPHPYHWAPFLLTGRGG